MGVLQTPHRRGKQTRLETAVLGFALPSFSLLDMLLFKSNVEPFNFSIVQRIGELKAVQGVRYLSHMGGMSAGLKVLAEVSLCQ